DAGDPEPAELTLARPAVAVGVLHGVHHLLVGGAETPAACALVALGPVEDLLVRLPRVDGSLDARHRSDPHLLHGLGIGWSHLHLALAAAEGRLPLGELVVAG